MKIYDSITTLPFSKFIGAVVYHNRRNLVIEEGATNRQLKDALEVIKKEYHDATHLDNNYSEEENFFMFAGIVLRQNDEAVEWVKSAMEVLKKLDLWRQVNEETDQAVSRLKDGINKMFSIDLMFNWRDPVSYNEDIIELQKRVSLAIQESELLNTLYENVREFWFHPGTKKTESYYRAILIICGYVYLHKKASEEITVYDFCDLLRRTNIHLKSIIKTPVNSNIQNGKR